MAGLYNEVNFVGEGGTSLVEDLAVAAVDDLPPPTAFFDALDGPEVHFEPIMTAFCHTVDGVDRQVNLFYRRSGSEANYSTSASSSLPTPNDVKELRILKGGISFSINIAEIRNYTIRMQSIDQDKAASVAESLNELLLNPADINKYDQLVLSLDADQEPVAGQGLFANYSARLMGIIEKNGETLAQEVSQAIVEWRVAEEEESNGQVLHPAT